MSGESVLKSIAKKTTEHEFYTPIPKGYKPGKTKYVVVFGTVMSGLGKGIFSASLAKLFQNKGLKIAPVKFDGYLNFDAGTLNPYRHGEVFVLDDGTECDMDLGTYERFLDINLSKHNYLTGGKVFAKVLNMEREGKYLGRDVQIIPHVTGEIKQFLRNLALKSKADVVSVEVGGTAGDLENSYVIEAMREFAYEEGKENVCFIALTYILEPKFLGEQKSKAAQIGIGHLLSKGIQPDVIACRASNPITNKIIEKISIYSNVPVSRVVGIHDVESIYVIPELLKDTKLDESIIKMLGLEKKVNKQKEKKNLVEWRAFSNKIKNSRKTINIGLTGKYTGLRDCYASIIKAIEHAGANSGAKVEIKWIETTDIEEGKMSVKDALKGLSGVIVPGGFGKRGTEGKISCIKYLRENNIPFLGLCLGFQMAVVEFARNVCKMNDANSSEFEPNCKENVIDLLPEQKKIEGLGGNMRLGGRDIEIKKGTLAYDLYGAGKARERFRHRYEANPKYVKKLESCGLIFSGKAPNQPIMQILELPKNRFFLGVQFHPEYTSRPLRPNPLFAGFVNACLKKKR